MDERRIADHLVAAEKAQVHYRAGHHSKPGVTNPNALVRYDSADPGRLTELRTLRVAHPRAVRDRILKTGEQVSHHGDVELVIDGRDVKLRESVAREGHTLASRQARREHRSLPLRVRLILAGGRILTFQDR